MSLHLTVSLFLLRYTVWSLLSANPVVLDKSRSLEGSGPVVQAGLCVCIFHFVPYSTSQWCSIHLFILGIVCLNASDTKCEGHSNLCLRMHTIKWLD